MSGWRCPRLAGALVVLVVLVVALVGCGSGGPERGSAEPLSSTTSGVTEASSTTLSAGGGGSSTTLPPPAGEAASGGDAGGDGTVPSAQSKSFSIDADGNVVEVPTVGGGAYSASELDGRVAAAGDDYCLLAGLADDLLGYGDVAGDVQAHLNLLNAEVHRRLIPHHPELAGELEGVAAALSAGDPIEAYRSSVSRVVEVDDKVFAVSDERCGE